MSGGIHEHSLIRRSVVLGIGLHVAGEVRGRQPATLRTRLPKERGLPEPLPSNFWVRDGATVRRPDLDRLEDGMLIQCWTL